MATREEWRRRILHDLGGEGTDPELSEEQLDSALARALELWNEHKPYLKWFPFEVRAAQTTIIDFFAKPEQTDGRAHPDTYVKNILAVQWQDRSPQVVGPRPGFSNVFLRWGHQGPRLHFQLSVASRVYERLTGSRPDWYFNREERKLYLTTPRDQRVMVLASRPRLIEEIPYDHEAKFLRAAVARAKYYLARNLESRGPLPGVGGNIETDAAKLRDESKEEWKEVEDGLRASIASWPSPEYIG